MTWFNHCKQMGSKTMQKLKKYYQNILTTTGSTSVKEVYFLLSSLETFIQAVFTMVSLV